MNKKPTQKLRILVMIFSLVFPTISLASNINGQIRIYKKNGKQPMPSFNNAIVYLEGISTPPIEEEAILAQVNKQFSKRLLAVVKGQTIKFPNYDRVQHNVFSTDKKNPFDLGRYRKGKAKSIELSKTGKLKVYCNIHQKMISDIIVLDNHYFSITDSSGQYNIKDIPPGEYTIHAWHIFGGESNKKITITHENIKMDFTLTNTKVIREISSHKNKYGQKYNQKGYDDYGSW